MNQPAKTYNLPPMGYPAVTRVVSLCPIEELKVTEVTWVVNQPHPVMNAWRIVRMFDGDAGVEVYSVSTDGSATPMRNRIPSMMIKLVEETMSMEVFIEEMARAESDDDDDDGDDEDDEGGPETGAGPSAPFSAPAASS